MATPTTKKSSFLTVNESALVRDGFDLFRKLQEERLAKQNLPKTSRSALSAEFCRVMDPLLSQCIPEVPMLWELFTLVMQMGEQGLETANAVEPFLRWHRKHFLDDDLLDKMVDVLQRSESALEPQDSAKVVRIAMQFLLCGDFSKAAECLDALVNAIRLQYRFNRDQEGCLTETIALIIEGEKVVTGEFPRSEWHKGANRIVADARMVFDVTTKPTGDLVVDVLLGSMLDMLMMMTNDQQTILRTVQEYKLGIIWYIAAQVALSFDHVALADCGYLFTGAAKEFQDAGMYAWYEDVAGALLTTTSAFGCIDALVKLWDHLSNADFSKPHQTSTVLCGKYMVSHLIDLCAPQQPINSEQMSHFFKRNEFLGFYTELFNKNKGMWLVAAQYLAFAPLCDPAKLVGALEQSVAEYGDSSTMNAFHTAMDFIKTSAAGNTPLQTAIRAYTKENVPLKQAGDVFQATEEALIELKGRLCRAAFDTLSQKKRYSQAIALSLNYQTEVEEDGVGLLRKLMENDDVVGCNAVAMIGEGVHSGLLVLPAKKTKLRQMLQIAAYVSDVTAFSEGRGVNGNDTNQLVQSAVAALEMDDREHLNSATRLKMIEIVLNAVSVSGPAAVGSTDLIKINQHLSHLPQTAEAKELLSQVVSLLAQP